MAGPAVDLRRQPPPQPQHLVSDTDSDSGSDSDIHHNRHDDLSNSIFKAYLECHSSSSPSSVDLAKIQSFLASSSSGALSCLICLERIRRTDPTWSCTSLCFAVFHLVCIQSWARQSLDLQAARAATRSSASDTDTAVWNCPKCRSSYGKSEIPRRYICYCGKEEDPPGDNPWILPHSCGEVCGRPLSNNCGHCCLLLCHPGPCAPCPKLVKALCFCGGVEDVRRCGHKQFSCGNACNRVLDCDVHRCKEICHDGACPPCRERAVYSCCCDKVKEERDCCDRVFRCEAECKNMLNCGRHVCEKGCHSEKCGLCPYQGKRTCPCGKKMYQGLACDVTAPLCGSTCDKLLACGYHRCPDRCHRGPCLETCRIVVTKSCRCGGLRKQVPCHQELVCERKCQGVRDCGRHACRRRCCDGDCPPCSEICGRRLRCRNHKCPSPCHQGACAPCPIMVTISCACGETRFEVPCGTETDQKPPRCRKLCHVTPLCRHGPIIKPHRCHYGACPPCKLPCEEEFSCGHKCRLRCHGPRPPPKVEFIVKPTKKKLNIHSESTPGSPCPPCPEFLWKPCVGQHLGAERMMVCSDRTQFTCDNLCGNPLPCGNHYCTRTCHALKVRSSVSGSDKRSLLSGSDCEECDLPCEQERSPQCQHPCPLPCHPGDCPPCKVLIKRSCHCGTMVHAFKCISYNTLSEKDQIKVRSCGGPCHRKMQNCTHLCPEICHPGQCPLPDKCGKKVIVRCKCQTVKKELFCQDVQAMYRDKGSDPKDIPKNRFGIGVLPCNADCMSKIRAAEATLQQRKPKEADKVEAAAEKNGPKRKKRRERGQEAKQTSRLQKLVVTARKVVMFVMFIVVLAAVSYCGYKGLLWLNDWMNQLEEQRLKSRSRSSITDTCVMSEPSFSCGQKELKTRGGG
ncbi:PREDICTED: NF-X1-type zinc finger protein NFXL2 isoform X2 [Tarenaya hassleriana]|uniref:NF-X1-type zinc finger protein NFXL2 isoform X2 n=1 Tax=Tarenaya hassleriana TaxID=28532 RepID=UPI00053C4750|nr:PREDICTED: NF-X1-type zinc finger protein NFXL2 isoform X2 [Tarenaya hassleriana]